jgi:hypothetical protein
MGKYVFHTSALDRMREKDFGDSFHGTNFFNIELAFNRIVQSFDIDVVLMTRVKSTMVARIP